MIRKVAKFVWMFYGGVLVIGVMYGVAWMISQAVMLVIGSFG